MHATRIDAHRQKRIDYSPSQKTNRQWDVPKAPSSGGRKTMRAVLWMGSVVVASVVVIGASRLWAESKEKKPASRTRIGLVNLTYVIKNYDKYKEFQLEVKKFVEPFQERDAELRSQLEELR